MKRVDIIEWGIVTIGLIFGYKFFTSLLSALVQVFYGFQVGDDDIITTLLPTLVLIGVYAASFILLVRRSRQIAIYLAGVSPNEHVVLKIGKRSLLQVVLIGVCITTILSSIGDIFLYLFESFKREAGRRSFIENGGEAVNKYTFKVAAIQTVVALALLYFSKDVSRWFVRKNEVDELIFDSDPEN